MAADKRYGTGAETKERMQAHNFGKADTNDVLQGNKDSADNREDQNVAAAFLRRAKDAVKPMLVKNMFIKKLCCTVSSLMAPTPL